MARNQEQTIELTLLDRAIEAVEANPGSLFFAYLAENYIKEGNRELALSTLEFGVKINPTYITGQLLLAQLYLDDKNYEKAQPLYSKVLQLDSNNIKALHGLARIAFELNEFTPGITYLFKIIAIEPYNRSIVNEMTSRRKDYAEYLADKGTTLPSDLGNQTQASTSSQEFNVAPEEIISLDDNLLEDDFDLEGIDLHGRDELFSLDTDSQTKTKPKDQKELLQKLLKSKKSELSPELLTKTEKTIPTEQAIPDQVEFNFDETELLDELTISQELDSFPITNTSTKEIIDSPEQTDFIQIQEKAQIDKPETIDSDEPDTEILVSEFGKGIDNQENFEQSEVQNVGSLKELSDILGGADLPMQSIPEPQESPESSNERLDASDEILPPDLSTEFEELGNILDDLTGIESREEFVPPSDSSTDLEDLNLRQDFEPPAQSIEIENFESRNEFTAQENSEKTIDGLDVMSGFTPPTDTDDSIEGLEKSERFQPLSLDDDETESASIQVSNKQDILDALKLTQSQVALPTDIEESAAQPPEQHLNQTSVQTSEESKTDIFDSFEDLGDIDDLISKKTQDFDDVPDLIGLEQQETTEIKASNPPATKPDQNELIDETMFDDIFADSQDTPLTPESMASIGSGLSDELASLLKGVESDFENENLAPPDKEITPEFITQIDDKSSLAAALGVDINKSQIPVSSEPTQEKMDLKGSELLDMLKQQGFEETSNKEERPSSDFILDLSSFEVDGLESLTDTFDEIPVTDEFKSIPEEQPANNPPADDNYSSEKVVSNMEDLINALDLENIGDLSDFNSSKQTNIEKFTQAPLEPEIEKLPPKSLEPQLDDFAQDLPELELDDIEPEKFQEPEKLQESEKFQELDEVFDEKAKPNSIENEVVPDYTKSSRKQLAHKETDSQPFDEKEQRELEALLKNGEWGETSIQMKPEKFNFMDTDIIDDLPDDIFKPAEAPPELKQTPVASPTASSIQRAIDETQSEELSDKGVQDQSELEALLSSQEWRKELDKPIKKHKFSPDALNTDEELRKILSADVFKSDENVEISESQPKKLKVSTASTKPKKSENSPEEQLDGTGQIGQEKLEELLESEIWQKESKPQQEVSSFSMRAQDPEAVKELQDLMNGDIFEDTSQPKTVDKPVEELDDKYKGEIVTETMAEIFAAQGMTQDAINVYSKLVKLGTPDKAKRYQMRLDMLKTRLD